MSGATRLLEWLGVPLFIIAIAWEPNFAHGFINYNESGQHLAALHELSRGSLLFRDIFVQYGPLHYFVPHWATAVFGESVATLRGYFLLGEIAGFLAALGLCRALIPQRFFASLAAVAIAIEAHHPFWATRWGGFRFAFVYLSLWCLIASLREGRLAPLFLAGVCAGLAILHTYDAGAAAVLGGAAYFAHALLVRSEGLDAFRGVAIYALGIAASFLPFLVYLLATGTFGDYAAQLPLLSAERAWLQPIGRDTLTPTVLAPAVVYLLACGYFVREWSAGRAGQAGSASLAIVSASGLLLYAASFRAIRGPQFETSLPLAVAVLFFLIARGRVAFEDMRDRNGPRGAGWVGYGFMWLALLALAAGEIRTYGGGLREWARYQRDKGGLVARHLGADPLDEAYRAVELSSAGGVRVPLYQAFEIEEITAYLQSTTEPGDALLGYPDLGIFNFFADRPHATRFVIPILAAASDEWTAELMGVLRERPPPVVLIGNQLSTLARATRSRHEYLPEVPEIVRQLYTREKHFQRLDVYRLKAPDSK